MEETMRRRLNNQRGLTLIELLIGMLLAVMVGAGTFEFYQAQHELYMAQTDISERQGNLRVAIDEIARNVRQAGYRVSVGTAMRTSAAFDTLEIHIGKPTSAAVDTIRYYVNRADSPPALVKQINKTTPAIFAQGIDTALFVESSAPARQVAIMLVSVQQKQFENSALTTRRRLGETISLRNQ